MLTAQPVSDPRTSAEFLDSKIKNISDAELFASLDLDRPELREVSLASSRKDYPAAYGAWARYWNDVAPQRALFGDNSDYLARRDHVTRSIAAGKDACLALADRVLRHDIQGWGDVSIQHGPVVDFNADYGQSGKYGFHYWGFARPLVYAFLLTENQKYLDEFQSLFNAWYEQRDKVVGGFPNLDVIYYELGLGVRNRILLEYYFVPHEQRTIQTHERLLKTFLGAARWLYEEQKLGYRPHNWQMIGAYGLAHIALMLPEFRESRAWVDLATQRTLEHMEQDFFADGCFSERCPASYNIIAYRDPRNLATMLSSHPQHRALAEKLAPHLDRQVNFLTHVVAPDGYLPGINDGSRALLLKPIAAGRKPNAEPSTHFAPSGFTIMRSDFSPDARYLLINHGPCSGGHSHADALSFELHAFGQALAIDSGIGQTYDDPAHAAWYIQARAHNMLTIDGESPDRPAAAGTDVVWESTDRFDHFAATHLGYQKSKGIIHRRHIAFIKPGYFLVYDVIDAKAAPRSCSIEWNLHPTLALDKTNGPGLIVLPSHPWPKQSDTGWASVLGIRGFEEKTHAQIEWLRFIGNIEPGEVKTFAVLLYPFAADRPDVTLRAIDDSTFATDHANKTDTIRFAPRSIELTSP